MRVKIFFHKVYFSGELAADVWTIAPPWRDGQASSRLSQCEDRHEGDVPRARPATAAYLRHQAAERTVRWWLLAGARPAVGGTIKVAAQRGATNGLDDLAGDRRRSTIGPQQ
jgi:hypothetical protein